MENFSWRFAIKTNLITIFTIFAFSVSANAEWKLISERNNIKVYEKTNHKSEIIPLMAEAIVDYNVKQVVEVLGDTAKKKEWMPALHSARTVKQKSYWDRIEYSRSLVPWPFSDRDFVYHAKVEVLDNGKRYLAHMKSVEGVIPKVDGVVRAKMLDGTMDLKYVNESQTYIKMNFYSDPKGFLPRWLANWAQKTWPEDMIKAMRAQLSKIFPKMNSTQNK